MSVAYNLTMTDKPLPQQAQQADYFYETVNGTLWQPSNTSQAELSLVPRTPSVEHHVLQQGEITLRYAIPFLQRPYALVTGYFETENGAVKTGVSAWKFMQKKWQLYPRAEIIGMTTRGTEVQVYLKELDFGEPVEIWGYATVEALHPVAQIQAIHVPQNAELPPYLALYGSQL